MNADADWRARPLSELVQHILQTHHAFTRTAFARLRTPLAETLAADGGANAELALVERMFGELQDELFPHLLKEENILFPYIEELDGAGVPMAPFGTVAMPVQMMKRDHERDGAVLDALCEVTRNFTPPSGASATHAALYDGLRELVADLRAHIELENDVLFPRAIEAERRKRT